MLGWLSRPFRRAPRAQYEPIAVSESSHPARPVSMPPSESDSGASDPDATSSVSSGSSFGDLENAPETPLPKMALFVLCLMRCTEPIASTQVFPYIPQFLQHILPNVPHEELGYYAGLVESAFSAAQVCVVLLWGRLSDKYGRKPILLVGLSGVFVSVNAFGLAQSLPALIAARLIAGFSNGNIGVLKACIAELTDPTNQARAFAFVPLSFAIGTVVGTYIGGKLADPLNVLDKEGNYLPGREHDTRFFARHPFYFPCLVSSFFNLAAILLGTFCLRETLGTEPPSMPKPQPAHLPDSDLPQDETAPKDYGALSHPQARMAQSRDPLASGTLSSEAEVQQWRRSVQLPAAGASRETNPERQRKLSTERRLSSLYQDGEQNEGSALTVAALARADQSPRLGRRRSSAWDLVTGANRETGPDSRTLAPHLHVHGPGHYFHQHHSSGSRAPQCSLPGTASGDEETEQEPVHLVAPPLRSLMTADVLSVIASQCLLNLLNISYIAVLPLFCYTKPQHGGIGFTRNDIGNILGATGVLSIVVQLGLLPALMRLCHGSLGLIRRAVPVQSLVWICFPLAQHAAQQALKHHEGPFWTWAFIGAQVVLKVLTNTSLVAATVLINQHAPSRAALGAINGLSAMCGSLSRTIGPTASTSLFAYSATQGASLWRRESVWLVQIAISAVCFLLTLRIRPTSTGR